ncbi:hypothetical protein QJS66_13905 [Kocuria rhizophila]|nr:hypothetical protein QJS66_13905 [Kocuria rhizophila]
MLDLPDQGHGARGLGTPASCTRSASNRAENVMIVDLMRERPLPRGASPAPS